MFNMGEMLRRISTGELLEMMGEIERGKHLLLDVQEPREHESLRIPHFILLPPPKSNGDGRSSTLQRGSCHTIALAIGG